MEPIDPTTMHPGATGANCPAGTALAGTIYRHSASAAVPTPCGFLLESSDGGEGRSLWRRRREIFSELRPYAQELSPLLRACFARLDPTHLGYVRARRMGELLRDLLVWSHFRPWDYGGSTPAALTAAADWQRLSRQYIKVWLRSTRSYALVHSSHLP